MTEEIRIELQGQFGYQCVRIQQAQRLGVGSYGSVCRATLDELPCAAKLLHETFFGTHDPGVANFTARFEQECQFLSNLKHPCIIQFLGLVSDPRTSRPILLMELMDESLTKFLERTTNPLPYHVQVNFIHDTSLALTYLHSMKIIHRDLSSNNILLLAGCRAKVTDFGMSKIVDMNPRMTPLTQCPGTQEFMAPEALLVDPEYSYELDVFSAGVLIIEIITCRFPKPSDSKKAISYPGSPTGIIEVPVPERERRKDDLDRIPSTHPLLAITLRCIKDRAKERPSAAQLCQNLAALKTAPAYAESVQEWLGDAASLQQTRASLEGKEREIRHLRQQLVQNEQQLQETIQQLAEKEDSIRTKDQAIGAKDRQLLGKEREVSNLRREVANLQQQLKELPQGTQSKKPPIPDFSRTPPGAKSKPTQQKLILEWHTRRRAPEAMCRGAAVVHHNTLYCISGSEGSNKVHRYRLDEDMWQKHLECPFYNSGLAVIKDHLTAIGGKTRFRKTNKLATLRGQQWEKVYPPMNIARIDHAVVSDDSYVIAAGGEGGETSVELLNIGSETWSIVTSLPQPQQPLRDITATISCSILYIMERGGETYSTSLSNLTTNASELSDSQPNWQLLPCVPVEGSTLSTVSGEVVAVGGEKNFTTTKYVYQLCDREWVKIECMTTARYHPIVAVHPGDKMVVIGGLSSSSSSILTAVELAVLH